jgi:cytochrome c oxidase subunit 2
MMPAARAAAALSTALLLAGCEGIQTALGGDGAEGAKFVTLFTIFLVVTGTVYLLVIAFLVAAILRRRTERTHAVEQGTHHESHPLLRPALAGWAALVVIGLAILAIASFVTDRSLARPPREPQVAIKVTGNQWWWDVEYQEPSPAQNLRTANELHLPVGIPVRIRLESKDVIHSFWVPNLAGKQDLIPGRVNDIMFVPRKVGLFRGQCAEFCGTQHANMALVVQVESLADFRRWYAAQLAPAQPPRTPEALAGYQYVTTRECSVCHNISGTSAGGRVGPDLTHLASRRTIAAGALPMSEGNLYGWVADPQSQKPGTKMPTIGLDAQQLHAVVAYLEGLK